MTAPSSSHVREQTLRACALALSAAGLATLALTVAPRVLFPWPLEWMEGASMQHALRLLHGEPLYEPPSATFTPNLYPPLGYVPMALCAALFGPSLPAVRLASVLCMLSSLLLVGRAGARAAGDQAAGWLSAGMFAIGFGYCGAFLDLARVDGCFVVLLLAGAERLQAGRARAALSWFVLSVFAKQHGVLFLLAASLALLAKAPRRHAVAVALAWVVVIVAYLGLELASAGWFGRYTLALPRSHGVLWGLFGSYFAVDLLLYLPVLVLGLSFDLRRRARQLSEFDALPIAAALASALGRAHLGGHDNVRLPAFALLCIAGVAPLARLTSAESQRTSRRVLTLAALALQMAMLWQAPALHRPSKKSARAFEVLRASLVNCAHGDSAVALDYSLLTGTPFVHTMAISDLRMSRDVAFRHAGTDALLSGIAASTAPAAIAVGETFPGLDRALRLHYHECARVPAPRLATGYSPGLIIDGHLFQVVYVRD